MFKCRICNAEHETLEEVIGCESNCLKTKEEAEIQAKKESKENKIKELKKEYADYENIIKECFTKMSSIQDEIDELEGKTQIAHLLPNILRYF